MIFTSRPSINFRLHSFASKTVASVGLLTVLLSGPAFADDSADVTKLMRSGQYAQALSKADASLRKNPRNPEMRFLKGVILTEQNKSAEAITIFTKLTEDYPDLPEPYNNLAVLYASTGEYDKARKALDSAIRTNPSYATAYENLGDVHAKLASQAYDKALQIDSRNSGAKSKLTLVRSLVGNVNGTTVAQAPVAAKPQPADTTKQAQAPAVKTPPAAEPAKPAVEAKPEKPVVEAKPQKPAKVEPKPTKTVDVEHDNVLKAVHGWADAWSARDVKAYLDHYSSDFDIPKGTSRKAWEEQRRNLIVTKSSISVKIDNPKVTVKGKTATVKFLQTYASDRFSGKTRKTLVLTQQGGKWRIQQELTGN